MGKNFLAASFFAPRLRVVEVAIDSGRYCLCLPVRVCFFFEPQNFLNLPREHFDIWLAFVLFYPVLSVLPQELVYRVYVFEVHKTLLSPQLLALMVSAMAFAWLHIVFAGWFGVVSTFAAGLALAWNYFQNRNSPGAIWPLVLEHSLYGQIVFTIGLYQYFFIPR